LRTAVTWGHNEDHRPDPVQLLYILTVARDGAGPVHFRVESGSTADDRSRRDPWGKAETDAAARLPTIERAVERLMGPRGRLPAGCAESRLERYEFRDSSGLERATRATRR